MLTSRPTPNYDGDGIVNLMARLNSAMGGDAGWYPPMDLPGAPVLDQAPTVVLWIVDGLGDRYLAARPSSMLAAYRRRAATSVFPATTSAAVTTFHTGLAPRAHGVTGWFMHVRELGAVTAWLPFKPRCGGPVWTDQVPAAAELLEQPALADGWPAEAHQVMPHAIINTPYTRATAGRAVAHGYKRLEELVERVATLARHDGSERRYIYAYWPDFDALCHERGVGSPEAAALFEQADAAFARLLERVAGTGAAVVVTADHGFVDTAPSRMIHLRDHPDLADCLSLPLCGEPRAAYCYLRPGMEQRFDAYAAEHLADCCAVYSSGELVDRNWFGPEPEHPAFRHRIGDRVLLPADGWVVKDAVVGERPFRQIGVHGGASADEQLVPVVLAAP